MFLSQTFMINELKTKKDIIIPMETKMDKENKYGRGKIYTIRSHQTELFYIGSTTNTLVKRFSNHKAEFKRDTLSSTSKDILKFEDAYIELLEDYPCENKNQLNRREGERIREFRDSCVNIGIAGRTKKEYYTENKERENERSRLYKSENKERENERSRLYYVENKVKLNKRRNIYRLKKKTLGSLETLQNLASLDTLPN